MRFRKRTQIPRKPNLNPESKPESPSDLISRIAPPMQKEKERFVSLAKFRSFRRELMFQMFQLPGPKSLSFPSLPLGVNFDGNDQREVLDPKSYPNTPPPGH
jgi:hypothetical protein